MVLITPYGLKVPSDSIVVLATAGVLGETYVTIDTSRASGPPVGAGGVLKSKPIAELSTEQMIQKLREFMQKSGNCDCKKNITEAEKLLSSN